MTEKSQMESTKLLKELKGLYDSAVDYGNAVHIQDYFASSGIFQNVIEHIAKIIEGDKESERELRNAVAELFRASEAEDRLLTADLLNRTILPWIEKQIDQIFSKNPHLENEIQEECYSYNCRILKEREPALFSAVSEYAKNSRDTYSLKMTNSGYYTLTGRDEKGNYYYHSSVKPYADGKRLANSIYHPRCNCYYIFGLGLGYHCKALAERNKWANITIFETEPGVIYQAMRANALDWLWDSSNIHLLYDEKLTKLMEYLKANDRLSTNTETILGIHYPSLRQIQLPEIRQGMEELFVGDNTIRNQGGLLESNFYANIQTHSFDLTNLRNLFLHKDALIVAGGPSLDRNLVQLKKRQNRHLIIAVGTVFKKLMMAGIRPDCVIISDAQVSIEKQFEGLWDENVPVLILATAYKGIGINYKGPKYLLFQEGYAESENMAKKEGCPLFLTGGSVSTLALDVCIRMGCDRVAFVGLDLAYTGNKSHSDNTALREEVKTKDWLMATGYTWEQEENRYLLKKTTVPISRTFGMYRKWIENRVRMKDVKIPILDATEGGALLEGIEPVRLQDYMLRTNAEG